jgi:hypothetical protein
MVVVQWLSPTLYEEFKKQMVEPVSCRARVIQQSEILLDEEEQQYIDVEQNEDSESKPVLLEVSMRIGRFMYKS